MLAMKNLGRPLLIAFLLSASACGGPGDVEGRKSPVWLSDITEESGLDFVHETGATGELLLPEIMASGVALFDYDDDGDLDVYFTTGNHELGGPPGGSATPNRLYRHDTGAVYVDVTEASGLGDLG